MLFSVSSFICAENKVDTLKVYSINEVIITGNYNKSTTKSTSPLQILSNSKISQLNVVQVSDVVKFFSGVNVKDYGGIGGLKTVSVRSLGAEHTAVSYDGITLSDSQTGQIDIGRFSLENVDLISLSNGQSDNIFQPARQYAAGSVLSIQTHFPAFTGKKLLNGKITLKNGSFGLINPSLCVEYKIHPKYSIILDGEWLSANGEYPYVLNYSLQPNGLSSSEKRKNSDVRQFRLETGSYAVFSEKASGFWKAYFFNSNRGLPGATIFYNENAFSSQRLKDNTFFTQLHYQNNFSKHLAFQLNAKYHHGEINYTDSTALNIAGYEDSKYTQSEFYGSIAVLYRIIEHLSLDFSSDGIFNDLTAKYENDALTNEFACPKRYNLLSVLALKYANNHLMATGSLLSSYLFEHNVMFSTTNYYNKLSPYVSISFQPFEKTNLRIRGFYKNIFRLPTFNDLYFGRIGNADLKPETTNQYNLGLTYSFSIKNVLPAFTFTADFYKNNIQDKIVAMPTKNIFIWSMTNLGKVDISGFDLSSEIIFSLGSNSSLNIGGTYTYQKALDVTLPGNETYQHQIPYTPRVSGSGRMALELPWINLGYSVLWSGARYAGYQNYAENRLSGYSDHSISASHVFEINKSKFLIKAEALNFLNANYEIIRYFPMPGRSFRATVQLKL